MGQRREARCRAIAYAARASPELVLLRQLTHRESNGAAERDLKQQDPDFLTAFQQATNMSPLNTMRALFAFV